MSDYHYVGKDGKTDLARAHDEIKALRARLEAVEKERDEARTGLNIAWADRDMHSARAERAEAALALRSGECEAKKIIIAQLEAALATARRDALEKAAQMVEEHFPATQDMESTMICGALEEVAAAIRALANKAET